MDEVARRYLLLALRIERLRPGFISAYAGPPELAEAVAWEPTPLPVELHDEAMVLGGIVADASIPEPRSAWLGAQLDAMSTVARVCGGEEIAYPELAEELLDQPAEPVPEQAFVTAHRVLDAALPGAGPLAARLAEHRRANRLAPAQAESLLRRALALLRSRTRDDIGLPDEHLEVVPRNGLSDGWRLVAGGRASSVLEVDLEAAWTIPGLYRLAAVAYPGWHATRVARAARGGELLVICAPTPEMSLTEAIGHVGREVILPDFELEAEMAAAGRGLGLRLDLEREAAVRRAEDLLAAVPASMAFGVAHEGVSRTDALAYLMETGLLDRAEAERELHRMEDALDSVGAFARSGSVGLVREWLERSGQTRGLARLMTEPLAPRWLRAEIGEAPALYPASFV